MPFLGITETCRKPPYRDQIRSKGLSGADYTSSLHIPGACACGFLFSLFVFYHYFWPTVVHFQLTLFPGKHRRTVRFNQPTGRNPGFHPVNAFLGRFQNMGGSGVRFEPFQAAGQQPGKEKLNIKKSS